MDTSDLPPFSLVPIPISREDLDLRLRSIGMPPEAIVVCDALGPLDYLDRRLAGCVWKILGREVPLTDELPDYPFLRLVQADVTVRQVQIWMWQIWTDEFPAFAEYRWHPERGEHLHFVSLSQDRQARQRQCVRLDQLFEITKYRYKLGRPMGTHRPGAGTYPDLDSFLAAAFKARDDHRRLGRPFTQDSLARDLGMSELSFKRALRKCHLRWESFLARR